jgi:hypothetical protein
MTAALTTVLAGPSGRATSQTTDRPQAAIQIPSTAQEHLSAAADALNGINSSALKGGAATGVASVRRDFQQMQNALTNPGSSTTDWRSAYSMIERDLTALIGSPGRATTAGGQPAGLPELDSVTSGGLELFRSSLELFYTTMLAVQPPPGTTSRPASSTGAQSSGFLSTAQAPPAGATGRTPIDANGAAALLDRIDAIVSAILENRPIPGSDVAVGTSGTTPSTDKKNTAGRVTVDRATLDEVLAEVQQLKVMLRVRK